MNRWNLGLALAAVCAIAAPAPAAVISRDWKTPGDGLLTYDDVNRREWLDLAESRLTMFPGTTIEQRYQNALLELVPGGMYEGFTVATRTEVNELATSAGIDISTREYAINSAATTALVGLVDSDPLTTLSETVYAIGVLDEGGPLGPAPSARVIADLRVSPTSGGIGDAGLRIHTGLEPFQIPAVGVWLYRPTPEPASWILNALGIGVVKTFSTRRRRSQHRVNNVRRLQVESLEEGQKRFQEPFLPRKAVGMAPLISRFTPRGV